MALALAMNRAISLSLHLVSIPVSVIAHTLHVLLHVELLRDETKSIENSGRTPWHHHRAEGLGQQIYISPVQVSELFIHKLQRQAEP